MEVLALPAHVLMRLGEQRDRLAPAIAALLPATHAALGRLEAALRLAIPAGMEDACPVGESGEGFQAKVYAGLLPSRREWLR